MTSRYKGRSGFREIAGLYPYVVEIVVPPGGLGRRLYDMREFHRQRGIKDQRGPRRRDDEHDYLRWCFADLATAEVFAAEFGGEILQQKSRPITEACSLLLWLWRSLALRLRRTVTAAL
jgi:hypothetical protein